MWTDDAVIGTGLNCGISDMRQEMYELVEQDLILRDSS